MNNNIYCRNCGKRGHKYKDCLYPRLSYGIVLFNDNDEKDFVRNWFFVLSFNDGFF